MTDKERIIELFYKKVMGKKPDVSKINKKYDGKYGSWLENQFGIKANSNNSPDLFGYELKKEGEKKISFGDYSANEYIYTQEEYKNIFVHKHKYKNQDIFLKIFGKSNTKKDGRFSWSGDPCPKIGNYNEFGQKLIVEDNKDIVAIYSYKNDKRIDKSKIVPEVLQKENLIIARWYGVSCPNKKKKGSKEKTLKEKIEDKFNQKGWFICKTNKDGEYYKICFGEPIPYEKWIKYVEEGIVEFDSGMHEGNTRPYSGWRASKTFWNNLIVEEYPNDLGDSSINIDIGFSKLNTSKSGDVFKIIDLFAGIGARRLAFERLGGQTTYSLEPDKFAQRIYSANFNEISDEDIKEIDIKRIPNHDILISGLPVPFSLGRRKLGFEMAEKNIFYYLEEIIKNKKPKAIMIESIKGLLSYNNGINLKEILSTLEKLNYYVPSPQVLNGINFGLPLKKERLIIVGFNKEYLPETYSDFIYPVGKVNKVINLTNILEQKVDDKYTISDELLQRYLDGQKNGLLRDKVKICNIECEYISSIYYRYDSILIEQKDKNPRRLTPRECLRIHGFPENFIISINDVQAYRQFNKASCIPVIEYVAKEMLKYLKSYEIL